MPQRVDNRRHRPWIRLAAAFVGLMLFCSAAFGQVRRSEEQTRPKASPRSAAVTAGEQSSSKPEQPVEEREGQSSKSATPGLDQLLATALRNNPDILVAQAKLREAEAELARTRLGVLRQVIAHSHAIESQRNVIKQAENRVNQLKNTRDMHGQLYKKKAINTQTFMEAEYSVKEGELQLIQAKAKLAQLEAEMPYLVAKPPENLSRLPSAEAGKSGDRTSIRRVEIAVPGQIGVMEFGVDDIDYQARVMEEKGYARPTAPYRRRGLGVPGTTPRQSVRGEMAEKIRKALDSLNMVKFEDAPLLDVLKDFRKSYGIPFVLMPGVKEYEERLRLNLDLGEVPFGVALQAIQDTTAVAFTVRDYGILVSHSHGRSVMAPGVSVGEFWKGDSRSSKSTAPASKSK